MTKPTIDERIERSRERHKCTRAPAYPGQCWTCEALSIIDELKAMNKALLQVSADMRQGVRIDELEAENVKLKADVELAKLHWWKGKR